MAKLTLSDLSNLQNEQSVVATINANNALIEAAIENTLSRDGTSPNSMSAQLDMNSNRIINLPAPGSATEPLRLQDAEDLTGDIIITNSNASDIPFAPQGTIAASNVQAAIQEVRDEAQPLDATLTALAGLNTDTGFVAQTGTDTFAKRTLTAGTGISIANGSGASANPTISVSGTTLNSAMSEVNVIDYGAVADVEIVNDAVITATSATLTSATASFVDGDVGKTIIVENASALSSATVTMTIASPCVVTHNSHGFSWGAPVVFTTTGALPTGLTVGTVYYIRDETTNTYRVAATRGGVAINTSGTQSGTHTATYVAALQTTIASKTNSTTIVLNTTAGVTGTGRGIQWGTDSTTAFNNAISALTNGGRVKIPCGVYQASCINLSHKINIVFEGAVWGVNGAANPALFGAFTGSVILPINSSAALLDVVGTSQIRVQDLQLGDSRSPAEGRHAILIADSASRSGDSTELRNVFITGRWASGALYVYGQPIDIRDCRFWNYGGLINSWAAMFTRDNTHSSTSPNVTISTATTGNPNCTVYNTEFHNFTGYETYRGAVNLRGALLISFHSCLFDSSSLTFGSLVFDSVSGTHNSAVTTDNTLYSESSPLVTNNYSLYCNSDLTWWGLGNSFTFTTARKGGAGTLTYGALDS